jgi:hypothetical protein
VLRLYKVLGFVYVLHLPEICCKGRRQEVETLYILILRGKGTNYKKRIRIGEDFRREVYRRKVTEDLKIDSRLKFFLPKYYCVY